jgi:hypothetical protein
MSSVTLDLPEETRRRLEDKAARSGQPLEAYIRGVLETEVGLTNGAPAGARPALSASQAVEEFDRWLAELEKLPPIPLPAVPCDWTREDIYFDHD